MIHQLLVATVFLAASPYRPLPAEHGAAAKTSCVKEKPVKATSSGEARGQAVANLPYAMGKTFATLDAYLQHLECYAGPIGLPWWREVRPGVYVHVKTATNAQPETATRAELMKRFGFTG